MPPKALKKISKKVDVMVCVTGVVTLAWDNEPVNRKSPYGESEKADPDDIREGA